MLIIVIVTVSQFGNSVSKPVHNCSFNNKTELVCTNSSNNHETDIGVVCRTSTDPDLILSSISCHNDNNTFFRLTELDFGHKEGRVEVCQHGCWTTVCYSKDQKVAEAICKQLGFLSEGKYKQT